MSTRAHYSKGFFTYADYKNWPDDERWEIIDGEAYMSAAPSRMHQEIIVEMSRQIANFLEDRPCRVYSGPFNILLPAGDENEEQTSCIVEPDISVICDESKLTEKGCTGAPDIIIEVVSPYGKRRDQITKLELYERKDVQEYWIVHSIDKLMWRYVKTGSEYGKPEVLDNRSRVKTPVLPGFELDLMKVFGPDPEEAHSPSPAKYQPQPDLKSTEKA